MTPKQILSCDWGTSAFRLRLVDVADGSVVCETSDDKGIAAAFNEWSKSGFAESGRSGFYKNVLREQIKKITAGSLTGIPIIISGMASSSIGMKELPYKKIPFDISGDKLNVFKMEQSENFEHDILLVSGLRTNNEVMRGEETMLLGCGIDDENERFAIFPGTHSKHIAIKNKILTEFKTYMTGEVFNLLATESILSKSIVLKEDKYYKDVFERGVEEGANGNLLNIIFQVRTNDLFKNMSQEKNYDYLSGLLIGSELKEIPAGLSEILLVCNSVIRDRYFQALQVLYRGDNIRVFDADEALVKAHCKLSNLFL
jgi:2-dehydro-3-deoxygalactonokinase